MIEYRRIAPQVAEKQYMDLFADAFPENLGTSLASPEHYRWKFRSPAMGPAFEFGAYEDGQLAGYYAALPYPYSIAGRELPVAMVCDVMTRTSMRGKGIFTALGRCATRAMSETGISFCTGYPVRPEVLPGHLKVGWEVLFPLPVYLKLLDATPLLEEHGMGWMGRSMQPLLLGYQALCRAARGLPSREPSPRSEELRVDEFLTQPGYPAFLSQWSSQYRHFLRKTESFLRWRLSAPEAVYCIVTLRRGPEMAAVAVTRRTQLKGLDVIAVLDLMIPAEYLDLAPAMHAALEDYARANGSAGVALMCTRPEAAAWQLAAHGYWRIPYEFKLIVKRLAPEPEPDGFRDPAAWHLMWIDSDDL